MTSRQGEASSARAPGEAGSSRTRAGRTPAAVKIVLACSECGLRGYKTKRKPGQQIELKKFCKECKRHTLHREAR